MQSREETNCPPNLLHDAFRHALRSGSLNADVLAQFGLADSTWWTNFLQLAPIQAEMLGVSLTSYFALKMLGIHGDDNRVPANNLEHSLPMHAAARRAMRSVALVTDKNSIDYGSVKISGKPETVVSSAVSGTATAFLVTPTHVVTAGHVVAGGNISRLRFAFGFRSAAHLSTDGKRYTFERSHVVKARKIIAALDEKGVGDIAVLQLDGTVPSTVAKTIRLAPRNKLRRLQETAMLSHAHGGPLCAVTRKTGNADFWSYPAILEFDDSYIYSNLDAFAGSSGSPLLDAQGRLIAVHCKSAPETVNGGDVTYSTKCAGSWATRIEVFEQVFRAIGVHRPAS